MYIIVIEWDGKKPPTTYYNRLRSYGIHVGRKTFDGGLKVDKNLGPSARRSFKKVATGSGTIVQEGAIVCASESLARNVALLAEEHGARTVQYGSVELEDVVMSNEDYEIINRVEKHLGKRGRPSVELFNWTVTCLEECKTFFVEDKRFVTNCPNCNGLRIKTRKGEPTKLAIPDTGDIIEDWFRHRFSSGEFEIPLDDTVEPPVIDIESLDEKERDAVKAVKNSALNDLLSALTIKEEAFEILDSVFASRAFISQKARNDSRVRACANLFGLGVDPADVSLIENVASADLLDATPVYGLENTVELYQTLTLGG